MTPAWTASAIAEGVECAATWMRLAQGFRLAADELLALLEAEPATRPGLVALP